MICLQKLSRLDNSGDRGGKCFFNDNALAYHSRCPVNQIWCQSCCVIVVVDKCPKSLQLGGRLIEYHCTCNHCEVHTLHSSAPQGRCIFVNSTFV
ncbi:hypothetical protein NPIL_59541 [Nephila pilipes]|uniref:Uncharacterized protein n=1 Tax=Nephila pilipes TaxID=299642 RepID=A0A8X6U7K4_NEPPI|nr:hypothetical protein NPIL_59541 [Nephila pilipes]